MSNPQLTLFTSLDAAPAVPNGSDVARAFNERQHHRKEALRRMRRGEWLTDSAWKEIFPGARIAPTVERLRNAHGFNIAGDGSEGNPYHMLDRHQQPQMIESNDTIKSLYYESAHWQSVRLLRMEHDNFKCVLCQAEFTLQVHHVVYHLFREQLRELMTVCGDCHEIIHKKSRLSFPSGISVEDVKRLGIEPVFESWLLA